MSYNNPTLTIVIPCFNHVNLTSYMLESIIANTFQSWELLVVDDGSTDDEFAKLKKYETADNRIHIIKRTDDYAKGAPACRNIGMTMALGEFIVLFDSDDIITPDCLGVRVKNIEKNKDMDFMVFPSGIIRGNVFVSRIVKQSCGYDIYADDKAMFASRKLPFIVWNNIYRVSSLKRYGIKWDEKLLSLQDADFNAQALLSGMKYCYAQTSPDYGYRLTGNPGSISKKVLSKHHYDSTLYALEKFYNMYQSTNGHKYDFRLFLGALWIYNHVMSSRFDKDFAINVLQIVRRFDKKRSVVLNFLIKTTFLLRHIIPEKPARQLPMLPYLLWREALTKLSEHRMKKIYNNHG